MLVEHPKYAIRFPRVSPDEHWILFQTVISQTQRQIFAAPLGGWRAAPESSWIPITNGRTPSIVMPCGLLAAASSTSSPNAMDFGAFGRKRWMPPRNSREANHSPCSTFMKRADDSHPTIFVGLTLTVGPDKIAFPMRERTGNIWLATLETR